MAELRYAVGPRAARLAEVHRSAELALRMAATPTLRSGWTRLSLADLAGAAEALRDHVLAPLDSSPNRDALLRTVEVFGRHGSVPRFRRGASLPPQHRAGPLSPRAGIDGARRHPTADAAVVLLAILRP